MKEQKATNVTWHEHKVSKQDREHLLNQKGAVLWFTGLSGSGKSTIANEVAYRLRLIRYIRFARLVVFLVRLWTCRA